MPSLISRVSDEPLTSIDVQFERVASLTHHTTSYKIENKNKNFPSIGKRYDLAF